MLMRNRWLEQMKPPLERTPENIKSLASALNHLRFFQMQLTKIKLKLSGVLHYGARLERIGSSMNTA